MGSICRHYPKIIRKIYVWNAKTIANDLFVIKLRCGQKQNPKKLRKKSRLIRPKNVALSRWRFAKDQTDILTPSKCHQFWIRR